MAQLPTFTWKFQAALSLARECCCLVAHSCPTVCNPMDCSLPGSSVCGIFQARILEWVTISFSRGSSQLRNPNCHLLHWLADSLALNHLGSPARKYWRENRKLIPSSTVLEILFSFPSSPAIDIYSFFLQLFKRIFFNVDHFYSLYWLCYNTACLLCFGFLAPKQVGSQLPQPGVKPTTPALEGEVLTSGQPGTSLIFTFESLSCIQSRF